MRIFTDEIINAVCLHLAERRGVRPTDIEVQLAWDEEYGYTAEVWVSGRTQYLIESNMREAIGQYVFTEYNRRVFPSDIEMGVDEDTGQFWAQMND